MIVQPSAHAGGAPEPSLEAVFKAEQSPLLRYTFGLVGRREVAEELVQDAFMRLHQHWDEVVTPRAWLFRCVRNRAFNHLRDHRREILTSPDTPDTYVASDFDPKSAMGQEAPDDVLGKLEAAGMLHVLVQDLEERDREMLRLKYVEGMTYSQIGERIDMSVGNVGWRLHHVLKNLADALRRSGVEGARG
jgi:RNA polymerase sigma-70 factor (ECF subfamily)